MVDWWWDESVISQYVLVETYYEDGTYEDTLHILYTDGTTISGESGGTWSIDDQVITLNYTWNYLTTWTDEETFTSTDTHTFSAYIEIDNNPDYIYYLSGDGYSWGSVPYEP